MHELSITEHLLRDCLETAKQQHARRILAIRLRMGPLNGLVPECIQLYLDLLAEGTIAEGAKIEATILPLKIRCRDCGREGEIIRRHLACPFCQSLRLQILSGKEFLIDSMEVETDETEGGLNHHGN